MEQKVTQGVQKVFSKAQAQRIKHVYHRSRLHFMKLRYGNPAQNARIIAVTGNVGKTTTAQLLMNILLEAGHSVAVYDPGVHGETLTSLWRGLQAAKKQAAEFIIIEVSPNLLKSAALDMLTLNMVVVTNACPESRLLLTRAVDYAVIPDDHESGSLPVAEHQIASFGSSKEADIKIESAKLFRKGTEINLTLDQHTTFQAATHLLGYANVPNVAAAVATAYILGVPMNIVPDGIARLETIPTNFEYTKSEGPFSLVVDGAETEESAELIITSAKKLAKRRLVVALAIKKPHSGFLTRMQQHVSRLIVVGSDTKVPSIETVDSTQEARIIAERAAKKDDLVVLIGKPFIIKDS